jgi:S1-C subfamily serine protease
MKILNTFILFFISLNIFAQSTSWNEYKLKEQWKTNGLDEIEGIYEAVVSDKEDPKYKLGLIKNNDEYYLVMLNIPQNMITETRDVYNRVIKIQDHSNLWSIGDVKAYLTRTATPNLFKAKWYNAKKEVTENLYITLDVGFFKINWIDDNSQVVYLKTFPTANDNIIQSGNQSKSASGTGFGIASNGIIVTNYHVIDGAKTIKVRGVNSDFNKTYKAKVLVSDKNNDLALIQIDDYGFTSLGTIPYTIKTGLAGVGENIFVLGYPLRATMGDEIKLTNGIISSKTGFQGDITSYQISAPVQPGNSGGPLFDSKGNLIGIINAKHTGAENASYAVKTNYLTNLIDLLSSPPKLQTINSLTGKTLTQQVEMAKKFVFIIETE